MEFVLKVQIVCEVEATLLETINSHENIQHTFL